MSLYETGKTENNRDIDSLLAHNFKIITSNNGTFCFRIECSW